MIEEALDTVGRVSEGDFWNDAAQHGHWAETPFVVGDTGRLTTGIVDLVFEGAEGLKIVDYKTDLTLTADLYEAQLEAYRLALRSVGCDVAEASVVGVRSE